MRQAAAKLGDKLCDTRRWALGSVFALGASCIFPAVETFNASAGTAVTTTALLGTAMIADSIPSVKNALKGITARKNRTWLGKNFVNVAAGAGLLTAGALSAHDHYIEDKPLTDAVVDNTVMPAYKLVRFGIKEGAVPLGQWITDSTNSGIEWLLNGESRPSVKGLSYEEYVRQGGPNHFRGVDGVNLPRTTDYPDFNEHSSYRARCLGPKIKIVIDGGFYALDNDIMGVEAGRKGLDREAVDTYSGEDVRYENPSIC